MRVSSLVHRKVGFTLTELLVGITVLSLFIMLALGSIVPSFRIVRQAEESLAAQREVVMAFDKLVAEMSQLDRASVTAVPGAIAYLSDHPYRGTNPPLSDTVLADLAVVNPGRNWQKTIILRHRNGALWRREQPYEKGSSLWQVRSDDLLTVADLPGQQEKIYANNVELFEAAVAGRSRVLLKIRCVFRQAVKPAACELNLQIQMRGGQ